MVAYLLVGPLPIFFIAISKKSVNDPFSMTADPSA